MERRYERPAQKNKRIRRTITQWLTLATATIIGLSLLWPRVVEGNYLPQATTVFPKTSLPTVEDKTRYRPKYSHPAQSETADRVAELAKEAGYSINDINALLELMWRESGLRTTAQNPNSSAYGICQFLDSTWESTGIAKTSDLTQQVKACLIYIDNRYDTATKALAYQKANNYY